MRTLAFTDELRASNEPARRDVEDRHVAEDVIQRLIFRNILSGLADDEGEFGFGLVNHAGRDVSQVNRFAGADQVRGFVEIFIGKIIRGPFRPIDIVTKRGKKLARPCEGAVDLNVVYRHPTLLGQSFFESTAVLAPTFDDFFHDPLRSFGFARADTIADVHHHILVFDDADPVVIES